MTKTVIFSILGFFAVVILGAVMIISYCIGISNQDTRLRNAIAAKQRDNESELDNMHKKITQGAAITQEQWQTIKDLVVGNSQARKLEGGSLVNAVREAVPSTAQIDSRQLLNIMTSSRDAWTMRQKEILDMKREEDNLRTTYPSSLIVGSRPEVQVTIVTSSRASEAMRTGKDDDTELFHKAAK